jgi:two-component system chemotaxis response regulator CheY
LGVRQTDNDDPIGGSRVLIVDDEYHTRKTIRALLREMGCTKVHEASDGASGLDAVHILHPDVVLLDWEMPDMDGAEFVRRLRSDRRSAHANVPVITLTGHNEHTRVLDAVRHGVYEFLLKPASRGALAARLRSALRPEPSPARKLAS